MTKTSNSVKLVSMTLIQRINLKKAAIFMASITLFSFFPVLTPLFLQFCASSLSFSNLSFFNYTTERHYMFLFCNGILAFVIINSVLNTSSNTHLGNRRNSSDHHPITEKKSFDQEHQKPESSHGEEEILEMEDGFEERDEKEEEEEEEEDLNPMDEENEDGNGDGDELNKKCEEFIRRMRQGIRIEANQEMVLNQKRRRSYDFH